MMHRLLDRLTYANVVATLALFVALGGTSYAAIKLPRNSVGSTQIKTAAVHSGEIADRTIRLQDISKAARTSLRGLAGPQGAPGPAGAAAVRYFAAVSGAGELLRGNAKSGGRAGAIGTYTVGFEQSVSGCSYVATIGTTNATAAPAGRATVSDQNGSVGVQTYDAAGAPADLPFHLIAAC